MAALTPTGEQQAILIHLAKELRGIIDLLDEGDAEAAANQTPRK